MARFEKIVVVNELLCFVINNRERSSLSGIKPMLIAFYEDQEISSAKECLHGLMEGLKVSDLPRLVKRKGEDKLKNNVSDLIELFDILDEKLISDILPTFVAADLSRIPSFNTPLSTNELGLLTSRVEKLEKLFNSLDNIDEKLAKIDHKLGSATAEYAQTNLLIGEIKEGIKNPVQSTGAIIGPAPPSTFNGGDMGSITGINVVTRNVNGVDQTQDGGGWSIAHPARTRKSYAQITDSNRQNTTSSPPVSRSSAPPTMAKRLVGRGTSSTSSVHAGVKIVAKTVVHIDNIASECDVQELKDFLTEKQISVLGLYDANLWMRNNIERDSVKSYRLTVPRNQANILFDEDFWPAGVIVRLWQFKKRASPQNGAA